MKSPKERRFEEMSALKSELEGEYKIVKQYAFNETINKDLFKLLEHRLSKVRIRPYYTRIMYRYLKDVLDLDVPNELHKFFWIKLPFIAEAVITIQYYHNQILDHKDNIDKDRKRYKCNILGADALKHCLFEYIDDLEVLSFKERKYLSVEVRKMFKYVDVGQYIEKEWGIYDKLDNITSDDGCFSISNEIEEFIDEDICNKIFDWVKSEIDSQYHNFLKAYLRRVYLTCGTLYIKIIEIIINLLEIQEEEVSQSLLRFSQHFGMMRQIMNDYSDFIPKDLLPPKRNGIYNSFSDLKNWTITLPTLFHFSNEKYSIDDYFEKGNGVDGNKIFNDLKTSHGLHKAITITRLLRNECENILRINEPNKELIEMIIDILEIVNVNKFHSAIKKDKRKYRSYQKSGFYKKYKTRIDL